MYWLRGGGWKEGILYSRKVSSGAKYSYLLYEHFAYKNENYENFNNRIFAWTLTSLHIVKIEYGQLVFCKIFERPSKRLLIIQSYDRNRSYKPGARSSCCAVGHRWAAWVWSCSFGIRNKKNIILWAFWPDVRKLAQTKISHYTVGG